MRKDIVAKVPYFGGWSLIFAHKSIKFAKPIKKKTVVTPVAVSMHKQDAEESPADNISFPPLPVSKSLMEKVVNGWVADIGREMIEEAGCQVCGLLTLHKDLTKVSDLENKINFDLLDRSHCFDEEMVTRMEHKSEDDPVKPLPGPVLDTTCDSICTPCLTSLRKHKMPKNALARGLWVGQVPEELSCLTFAEKLLVARVRTNRYIVRVSSGLHKMSGNAIAYSMPVAKVYKELPPPREEFDEVLAFIFTAPVQPTSEKLKKIPLLVSHKRVYRALRWLKLNNIHYADLTISKKNLETYEDNQIPVPITFQKKRTRGWKQKP